jgi:hypothetical protein
MGSAEAELLRDQIRVLQLRMDAAEARAATTDKAIVIGRQEFSELKNTVARLTETIAGLLDG